MDFQAPGTKVYHIKNESINWKGSFVGNERTLGSITEMKLKDGLTDTNTFNPTEAIVLDCTNVQAQSDCC